MAQVIASRHPEVVEGLVLSNTCSLSGNMSKAGYQDLMKIIESQRKFKKWLAILPFPLIKRMMRWVVMKKKTDGFTPQEKTAMEELCGAMMELLTKSYEEHMIDFLCDAEHYFGMTRNDFAPWEGRVLLILSEDDTTFTPACREDLIALMPSPTVVTDLTGGHLALLVRLDQYADLVTDFIPPTHIGLFISGLPMWRKRKREFPLNSVSRVDQDMTSRPKASYSERKCQKSTFILTANSPIYPSPNSKENRLSHRPISSAIGTGGLSF